MHNTLDIKGKPADARHEGFQKTPWGIITQIFQITPKSCGEKRIICIISATLLNRWIYVDMRQKVYKGLYLQITGLDDKKQS